MMVKRQAHIYQTIHGYWTILNAKASFESVKGWKSWFFGLVDHDLEWSTTASWGSDFVQESDVTSEHERLKMVSYSSQKIVADQERKSSMLMQIAVALISFMAQCCCAEVQTTFYYDTR